MMDISFAQGLGLVSFVLGISTFYQKNDRRLKLMMVVFNLNHMVHYLLLGAVTSAVSAMLSACRSGLSIKYKSKRLAYCFIACNIVIGLNIAEQLVDLLPIIGTSIGTYAMFCLNGIKMRLAFLVGATVWLINNIVVGSWGGILLESTLLTVNIITIYRLSRSPLVIQTPH
ncbi:YgjV family protein [Photobacterium nomapromontoriensis]|uniref:YgjV family protein n=1 Tax=Photobacterium nomapromontoriensis TaxID=2910237 RepID=UPI003D0D1558